MGNGIAHVFAQSGHDVTLIDIAQTSLDKGVATIAKNLDRQVAKGSLTEDQKTATLQRIGTSSDMAAGVKDVELVVEAATENVDLKLKIFRDLDAHAPAACILATNTSSISITRIAAVTKRPGQVIGMHFMNPVPVMKLVEIIPGAETNPFLARNFYQWFEAHDKKPALSKDSPGFIVNRVARNFYGEPLRIVNTADENKMREVDQVLKDVGGFKMGPFELMDLIGIDINYSVTLSVWNAFDQNARFAPHPLQKQLVTENRLGRKTKRGFYSYE